MGSLLVAGFRPFFLLAGFTAVLMVPLWLAALGGHLPLDMTWHAHELIFGFAGAVLAGFFLTSVPRWTKSKPVAGAPLAALAVLWGAARALRFGAGGGAWGAADAVFLLVLAVVIAVPIVRANSTRNLPFPVLLLGMAGADMAGHLHPAWSLQAHRFAALSVMAILVIFGGRITPLFTRNALKGVATVRQRGRIDDLAIGTMLAVLGMSVLPFPAWMFAPAAWAAALAGALRMRGWATRHTAGEPLLWVLHAGYAWTSVALFCLGVAAVAPTLLSTSTAMHAVTVGALGTYTMGMMSRVTLGHTGRPRTASTLTGAAFAAIIGAGLVRVLGPVATPAAPVWALHTSGALWTLAFALFLVVHAPMLSLARPDGKKG